MIHVVCLCEKSMGVSPLKFAIWLSVFEMVFFPDPTGMPADSQLPLTFKSSEAKAGVTQEWHSRFRVGGLNSLATACVIDVAIGKYKGKATGETALLRQLLDYFNPGEVAVAESVPWMYTFWFAWSAMHPNSEVSQESVQN